MTTAFDVLGAAGSIVGIVGVGTQFYSMRRERAARERQAAWVSYPGRPQQQAPAPHQMPAQQVTPQQRQDDQPQPQLPQPWTSSAPAAPTQSAYPSSAPTREWAAPGAPAAGYDDAAPVVATPRRAGSIIAAVAMSLYLWVFTVLGFGWTFEPYDSKISADQLPSNLRVGVIWLLINVLWAGALVVKHARRRPPSRRRWVYAAAGAASLGFALLILIVDRTVVF